MSPADITAEHGRSVDSVRRALNRISDLAEREYGSVALRSNHVAEPVYEAVEEAKEATRRAVEAGAKTLEAAERGIDQKSEALIAWAARHGVDVDDSSDVWLSLQMGGVGSITLDGDSGSVSAVVRLWP